MAAGEALVAGVPLAQYAAVTAALAEPFPLDDVLAAESLDPAAWTEADLGWTERLAADASLLARYETDLAAAEDRLTRPVSPVDADLGAWVAFLSAFTASSDLLQQHGLGPNDLSRLRRRWTRRMKDDPALEKRAADLRKKGPGPLPPLRVGKAKLVGSGTQARSGSAPATEAAPADPSAERDARLLRAHRQTFTSISVATPQAAPVDAPPPSRHRPVHEEDSTLVGYELKGAELPFRATPSRAFLEAMDRPAAVPGEGSDGDTAALRAAQALRALPLGGEIEDEITHALPAALPEEEPPMPTLELHPVTAPDPAPSLSLERHASLCLELMVDPFRADETLARYQVTADDKDRADQFYKACFAADPALRAAWNQAFETYRLWFTQRSRG